MINAVHLKKSFGSVKAVDDVSLHIEKGEVICIIGPSGSGKSTLIRCLHGLETPDSGELYIDGQKIDFTKNNSKAFSRVGFVFQLFNLFPRKRRISCSPASGWTTRPRPTPTSSPAARSSVWRSPARCARTRRSSSLTSQPPRSTPK